jgi:Domain of unknown function DUF29
MVSNTHGAAAASLYETDFVQWAQDQAAELRRLQRDGAIGSLDLPNLAEEIEGLARAERRELANRIRTIIEHLIKLQASQVAEPRAGREETIDRSRIEIDGLLSDNTSLRRELDPMIRDQTSPAARLAASSFKGHGEPPRPFGALRFTREQVLGRPPSLIPSSERPVGARAFPH